MPAKNVTIVPFIAVNGQDDDDLMKIYRRKLLLGKEQEIYTKGGRKKQELIDMKSLLKISRRKKQSRYLFSAYVTAVLQIIQTKQLQIWNDPFVCVPHVYNKFYLG